MASRALPYSLGMSLLPFPADSAEFEEYTSVMNAMADEANASVPDPEPEPEGQYYEGWGPWVGKIRIKL